MNRVVALVQAVVVTGIVLGGAAVLGLSVRVFCAVSGIC